MIPLVERQKNLETLAKTALFKDYSIAYHDGTTYNGTDISDREYFQKAYNEDQIAISPPVIRKTDGSVTTMMAAPTKYSGMKYVIYGGLVPPCSLTVLTKSTWVTEAISLFLTGTVR